ncbi:MAG: nuclear transport factor 2 family protein [Longimicrobiales bacterium]
MNESHLRAFFDAWNRHDVDAVMQSFSDDCAYLASFGPERDGTAFRGVAEVRAGVAAFLSAFADARYTDLRTFLVGDRGVAEWTFSGTRADGEQITYRGCDVFEFAGDRIRMKDAFRKERAAPLRAGGGQAGKGSEAAVDIPCLLPDAPYAGAGGRHLHPAE